MIETELIENMIRWAMEKHKRKKEGRIDHGSDSASDGSLSLFDCRGGSVHFHSLYTFP